MSTDTQDPAGARTAPARAELAVGGMTCASCAARIERKLNRLDGARATVNFATETATVAYDPAAVTPDELVAVVEATGYTARLPQPPAPAEPASADEARDADRDEAAALRQRLVVSAVLTVPVVVLAMVPVWQFRFWQWLSLTLAAPVVV
ncbi:MAG TPA: cation transporter, partial [Frankiaceae bacterium]|nr:cation transporter [Frankiaceae bacterium]